MAQKKTYTNSQIGKYKEDLIKILNEWEISSLKRNTIVSLYTTAKKWNNAGGSLKKRQGDIKKNINALKNIIKRSPNNNHKSDLEGFEKELLVVEEEIKNKPKASK